MPNEPTDITLVTCDSRLDLSPSDRILRGALEALDLSVAVASWSAPQFDWSGTRLAVLRSAWDSHLRPQEFIRWVSQVSSLTAVCNLPSIIRWNFDKHYLIDLQARGIASIPSIYLSPNFTARLETRDIPWQIAVAKPAIGANSHNVRRFEVSTQISELNHHLQILRPMGALLQRYEPAVETLSERSLVFIEGQFTHAVRRVAFNRGDTPDTADFDHHPPPAEIAFATSVLKAADALESPFARVDLLPTPEHCLLMELELVDPSLFFTRKPAAAQKLAACLLHWLEVHQS